MKNKKNRHRIIKEILSTTSIGSQDDLLRVLDEKGFSLTQATLSRDLKSMRVVKRHTENGGYIYDLTEDMSIPSKISLPTTGKDDESDFSFSQRGFLSIEFSGNMAVIKTKPGYAAGIASDIDTYSYSHFIGSIAGDDTILLIIREGIKRESVMDALALVIPHIQN